MRKDLALVALLVMTLTLMAVPISQTLIDALLATNISLAVILLMVAVYIKRPSDFSTFPSVILIGTAFRLALSIGTTRLILSEADAGQIVETFGDVVVAGSVGIGLVIFLIITAVQFLVITKGAERIAEVGARFTLDALPGKQISIDAEVKAENITAEEGKRQRTMLDRDSQFFGAMDGAMKFVKGDAIAGLIIICINLIGGVIVGTTLHGYSFGEAISVFSLLTVGDGLVAQFPALLMALCAGIMVTRVTNDQAQDLGTDIVRELVSDARVPGIAAMIVLAIGMIPGFPTTAFTIIAATLLLISLVVRARLKREASNSKIVDAEEADATAKAEGDAASLPVSDRFHLSLSPLAMETIDRQTLEKLLDDRFWTLFTRRGVAFPRARITNAPPEDDTALFVVSLDEVPLLRITLAPGMRLLRHSDQDAAWDFAGEMETAEFESRLVEGSWVSEADAKRLEDVGIRCMTHEDLVAFAAFRLYEHNLGALFDNSVLEQLLVTMREADPASMEKVEELCERPALLKTFRYLVEDGVPLRPASLVAASLHYWLGSDQDAAQIVLAECLRGSMRRQLCHSIAGKAGVLGLALIDPDIELNIRRALGEMGPAAGDPATEGVFFEPQMHEALVGQFKQLERDNKDGSFQTTIIASADIRRRVRNYLASNDVHVPVLAPHEVAVEIPSFPLQIVSAREEEDVFDRKRALADS